MEIGRRSWHRTDDVRAEIVSQLAVESFVRAGMWTRTPAIERIGAWVELSARAGASPGARRAPPAP